MKGSKLLRPVGIALLITIVVLLIASFVFTTHNNLQTESITVRPVADQILAEGTVTSQNEAVLHFQTGGKLTYLSAKEGDTVYAGQTIGSLDTYNLQQQLQTALNNYKTTRDQFDQSQQNQSQGITQKTQAGSLNTTGAGIGSYGSSDSTTSYLDQVAQRIVDENQANLNNSVINVQIANYAIQLASITTPISGVVTHEDVTTAGVNVTPATTFVVDDPTSLVLRANVSENDIDFVSPGSSATIKVGGANGRTLSGIVDKIYPQKVTLPSGDNVYQVDITSNDLQADTQLGQTATVLIQSNAATDAILVPSWTIINHKYIWVLENGKAILKTVMIGKNHEQNVEVTSGLNLDDKIITNPKSIAENKYRML